MKVLLAETGAGSSPKQLAQAPRVCGSQGGGEGQVLLGVQMRHHTSPKEGQLIQTSIKRTWSAPKQAVGKPTANGDEAAMQHPGVCLPMGQAAQSELQRVSSERRKPTMDVGSFKNDRRESPELLFCVFFSFFLICL